LRKVNKSSELFDRAILKNESQNLNAASPMPSMCHANTRLDRIYRDLLERVLEVPGVRRASMGGHSLECSPDGLLPGAVVKLLFCDGN
jgi:hypothetical protein